MTQLPLQLILLAALAAVLACGPSLYTAKEQMKHGNVDEAAKVLEDLKVKNPDNVDVRLELAAAYYRKARSAIDEGDQLAYTENLNRAQEELIVATEKDPESHLPHTWFGIIKAYQGDMDASLESFRTALRLAKRGPRERMDPHLYTNLAHIYVYMGRLSDARRLVDRGRKMGATHSEIERIELLAAWKSGDMVEARDIFDMAAELTPGFADTWDTAKLPKPMESLEDFAAVCCANPTCGPHMVGACKKMRREVATRELDQDTVRKQLQLEMERRRELKKIYDERKDLEIKIEDPDPSE
ncbi:MAG: tetratricopeptide repeat protein [bacterium]|nr:tetratricopeptide repeat protein [bacterium]